MESKDETNQPHHAHDDQCVIPLLGEQLGFDLGCEADNKVEIPLSEGSTRFSSPEVDMEQYDHVVVCMSGGKDSIASLLRILEMGADRSRIELWHHEVDGREGSSLMDWPFMADYNRKLAAAFGLPLYFSWLDGGFEGEMLKENSFGRPHWIETPTGLVTLERDKSRAQPGTRLKFPQVSASLQTRWCSSALKIDVGRRALNNQARFNNKRTLFITGERRQESANRSKYNQLEPHACDRRGGRKGRHVDAWRPVLHWDEQQVWEILERHHVLAPVPYRLGWGRSSCMKCIFNDAEIWATLRHYFPGSLDRISAYEQRFGSTISRDRITVVDVSQQAEPMEITDTLALAQAMQSEYTLPVFATAKHDWNLPPGAFAKAGAGPT